MMERLWSPWRMKYVKTLKSSKNGCEFCGIDRDKNDTENFVVIRSKYNFVVMNIYPYNSGHLLIVPYKHTKNFTAIPVRILNESMALIHSSVAVLKSIYKPDGFNVGLNIGSAAGAGIVDHIHFHVVPRWKGDTNFLPVFGETKVISQDLKESYELIRAGFQKYNSTQS